MKRFFTLILVLLPVLCLAQTKESEKIFQEGVKFFDAERFEDALECFEKCDSLDKRSMKPKSKNYFRAELKIADCEEALSGQADTDGRYEDAVKIQSHVVEIRKKVLGEEHPDYAASLDNLAYYYSDIGNYAEAIRLGGEALEIQRKVLGEEHPDYASSLSNLSIYYSDIGNYSEAIRLGGEALEIRRKVLGEEHPDYALSLSNLAVFYDEIGNYSEAIRFGGEALEIRKKVLGEEHPDYASSLSNLSIYYSDIGNYSEALRLEKMALEIRRKVLGEEHPDYAISLSNLAAFYDEIGNYSEAIRFGGEALEIQRKVLGEEHPDCASSLSNLSYYYSDIGNYAEAIRLGGETLEIRRKVLGEEHPDYAISLNNLSFYYSDIGNYAEAIRLGGETLEIYRKVLGEEHPDYATSLSNLAKFNLFSHDYDRAVDFYKQSYHCTNSFIMKTFATMTSNERSIFWNKNSDFISKEILYAASKVDGKLNDLAYDSQIFSKGLLLNAELEIQKLIEQSGDSVFAEHYYKIKQYRAMLDQLYQLSVDERDLDVDSLAKIVDREERILVNSSKKLGDYTKNLSVSWKDVQKKLRDDDIAIEFANFRDTVEKRMYYVALVLKKGMPSPAFVKLYDTDDFYEVKTSEYYKTPKLYDLVWKPLEPYLEGVKSVYFSPSGQLHTIGIENLPDKAGKYFAEKFDTYRLSSTRVLALERTANPSRKASVYGGIQYDFSADDWKNLKVTIDSIRGNICDLPIIPKNLLRDSINYLNGTKHESDLIAKCLLSADYDVTQKTGLDATEESFKMLSGSGVQILHIGTHGFYQAEEDLKNANLSFYTSNQNDEDRSLSCSGLLFAGAKSALDPRREKDIPDGVDDGILTAKEISRLDFSGLDLVVLSACQTGLGEITGEGVFGLQRGFKKAGAQTIVMSLWKVSDSPTQLLMVEFFKNLTSGQSKRAAFLAAQKTVRAQYPDPLYWAAFVMIDGN